MEASIQEVARLTGTTSRTLRHYDAIGLLSPSRVGDNGYRWYDQDALVRLQRILLLRDLGLPLAQVRQVLDRQTDERQALEQHLGWLAAEQARLARQAASVRRTLIARQDGGRLMAAEMLDGFDHTQHQEEVEARWGTDAYASGDAWWRAMTEADRIAWKAQQEDLARDWRAAAEDGVAPDSPVAQDLAARHAAWLAAIPGTPGYGTGEPAPEYLAGLGEMYVADERFAAHYGGVRGATLVRDALRVRAARTR
ncbi:MAG: MerR family transcriptional regulator [Cellulomonadaceae bacterium]|nr:MerR family transcriptional regulator [Cellulomonadaceae bacterium]